MKPLSTATFLRQRDLNHSYKLVTNKYNGNLIGVLNDFRKEYDSKNDSILSSVISSVLAQVSRQMYEQRKMPELYAKRDFTYGSVLYIKGDELSTYHINYSNVVSLMIRGYVSTER